MAQNVTEAVSRIKHAGASNARKVPDPNTKDGFRIEINENGQWVTVIAGVSDAIAEDVLRQASNRVILG